MNRKTIGIIGCGAIGSAIAEHVSSKMENYVAKIVLWDADREKVDALSGRINNAIIASDLEDIAGKSDLLVEAAHPSAVPEVFNAALGARKDVMVMSIGGLLGNEDLFDKAREKGIKVMLPSGAIAGIDAMKAAGIAGIEEASITTRKPPKSIKGAPYLTEQNIDVDSISEETVIFDGTALEAVKGFPKNINVSALLSIAGIGPEKTRVRIVVSPAFTKNSHEIEVKGASGTIRARTENVPSPANPKTSYLAALAAIASLESYFDPIRIGT